jgi:hypothetical protein
MTIYKYVNRSDNEVTLSGHVFTARGDLTFDSTVTALDALDGISVDRYVDGVPTNVEFTPNEVASMRVDALGVNVPVSATTNMNVAAGTTAVSSMRIAEGVAPSTPVNGDVWVAADHKLYIRLNGVTKEVAFV